MLPMCQISNSLQTPVCLYQFIYLSGEAVIYNAEQQTQYKYQIHLSLQLL